MPSKNLLTLNNGWPFGDGPMTKGMRFESRDGRVFVVCASCPQGITALTDTDPDPLRPSYVVTLELLSLVSLITGSGVTSKRSLLKHTAELSLAFHVHVCFSQAGQG